MPMYARPSLTWNWNEPDEPVGVTVTVAVHTDDPSACGVHTGAPIVPTVTPDGVP